MATMGTYAVYNLVMGIVTLCGLLYLLYAQQFVVGYRRFLDYLIFGFLLFAIGGPLADLLAPHWIHLVHGLAALFVVLGLFDPVRRDLRSEEWAELVLNDPAAVRDPAEWMTPMDEKILDLYRTTDIVLSPAIIAYNVDHSREAVSRRLSTLTEHGFVEHVDHGKYRMTDLGEHYRNLYVDRTVGRSGTTEMLSSD